MGRVDERFPFALSKYDAMWAYGKRHSSAFSIRDISSLSDVCPVDPMWQWWSSKTARSNALHSQTGIHWCWRRLSWVLASTGDWEHPGGNELGAIFSVKHTHMASHLAHTQYNRCWSGLLRNQHRKDISWQCERHWMTCQRYPDSISSLLNFTCQQGCWGILNTDLVKQASAE